MEFVAVKTSTANADLSSVCQLVLATHRGELVEEWHSYVDPEDYFDEINIAINGIDESTVEGAPLLPDLAEHIQGLLKDKVAVCHTPVARVALRRAFEKHDLPAIDCQWLDSARIARRTWEGVARSGYGLEPVCEKLGHKFQRHVAREDARAIGVVIRGAMEKTGLDLAALMEMAARSRERHTKREANPDGDLYGEVMVFTGALELMRSQAADMAAEIGCEVAHSVTKKTTMLVVGNQDVRQLAGHEKSRKHRKAEQLIVKGRHIRILSEADFIMLCELGN